MKLQKYCLFNCIATQLYGKKEVIAIFLFKNIQKPREIKDFNKNKIKKGCQFDTTVKG